jgi:hypothetical protein
MEEEIKYTDNLVIEEVTESNTISEEEEGVVEFTNNSDYISASTNCLYVLNDIDVLLLSKEDEKRVKRIRRKALKIMDICLSEMYDELFDGDEED